MHLYRRSFGILGGPVSAHDLPVSSSYADEFTATLNPQSLMDSRPFSHVASEFFARLLRGVT